MFIDHYLDPIFPLEEQKKNTAKQPAGGKKGFTNAVNGDDANGHRAEEEADNYLGAIVDVDTETEIKRRVMVRRKSLVSNEAAAAAGTNDHHQATAMNGSAIGGTYGTINGMANEERMVVAVPARGKTVRELSRLWKYLGGEVPED